MRFSGRGKTALAAAVVFLAAAAPYLPTLRYPFVWDDHALIVTNPFVQDVRYVPQIVMNTVWGRGEHLDRCRVFYRPLILMSYLADYTAWNLKPWGFHLTNVLGHALASVLAFFVLRALAGGIGIPFAAALLFALHPAHTESVAWISGRTDVVCAVFYFLAIFLFLTAADRKGGARIGRKIAYVGSFLAFVLALLSKEMALTLPLALVLSALFRGPLRREAPGPWRPVALAIVPFFLLAGVYAAGRIFATGSLATTSYDLPPIRLALAASHVVWKYARILALPIQLDSHYPDHPGESSEGPMPWIWLLLLVDLAALALASVRRRPALVFALAWTAITLVPVLRLGSFGDVMLADRFLYIPSLGALFGLAALVGGAANGKRGRLAAIALVASIGAADCVLTIERNRVWDGDAALFGEALKTNPDSVYVRSSLGLALARLGRDEEALAQYEEALKRAPSSPLVYVNAGVLYQKRGDFGKARAAYLGAIQVRPDDPAGYFNLAHLNQAEGKFDDAIALYGAALDRNPFHPDAENGLGYCLAEKGKYVEAVEAYKRAIDIDRNFVRAWTNLGAALFALNHMKAAAQVFAEAARLAPEDAAVHANLASVLIRLGEEDRAFAEYQRAAKLDPHRADYQLGIASILLGRKDPKAAVDVVEQVLLRQPGNEEAVLMLGLAREAAGQRGLAIQAYRSYLDHAAGSPNAEKVQAHLAALEAKGGGAQRP